MPSIERFQVADTVRSFHNMTLTYAADLNGTTNITVQVTDLAG